MQTHLTNCPNHLLHKTLKPCARGIPFADDPRGDVRRRDDAEGLDLKQGITPHLFQPSLAIAPFGEDLDRDRGHVLRCVQEPIRRHLAYDVAILAFENYIWNRTKPGCNVFSLLYKTLPNQMGKFVCHS